MANAVKMRRAVDGQANREARVERVNEKLASVSRPFPELRIIQDASTNLGNNRDDLGDEHALGWVDFLNHIGRKNRGKGLARSLGSVSLTIVPAVEIGKMMERKHGERYRKPEEAQKLLKALAVRTREFLYEKQVTTADTRARELYDQLKPRAIEDMSDYAFSYDIEAAQNRVEVDAQDEPLSLLTADRLSVEEKLDVEADLRRHLFGEMVYRLPDTDTIQPYSRNTYGLDLSLNEGIDIQRESLKTYFGKKEGLDTGLMDNGWQPHAVIFNLLPHLTNHSTSLEYAKHMQPPLEITFEPIRMDASGNDDILFE